MSKSVKDGKILTQKEKNKIALDKAKKKIKDKDYNVFSGQIQKDKNKQTGENKRRVTTSDVINTGSMLVGGPLLGTGAKIGGNIISKLAPKIKNLFRGASKTKPNVSANTNKISKTSKNTKTTKTNKNNKKTKVTPTTVTKPKQGPFPKVYKKPIGPKPKTSTRISNFVKKNKVPIIAGASALGTGTALLSGSGSNKDKNKNKKKKDFGLGGTDNINLKPSAKQGPSRGPLKAKPVKKKSRSNIKGSSSYDADFTRKNLEKRGLKAKNFMSPKNFGSTTKEKERKIGVAGNFNTGGKMVKRAAGGLKPVPEGNKGLGKLPSPVRNKMGYMRKGGVVKMRGGGAATKGMNFNRGY